MKIFAIAVLLAFTSNAAWAQYSNNPHIDAAVRNMGATTSGMLNPPGSMYAFPYMMDPLNGDEEPYDMGPVIEIEGEGVKKVPDFAGPVRSNSVHGNIIPPAR